MHSINYAKDLHQQPRARYLTTKGKYEIERLKTNPSFFTKTFETQDASLYFGQHNQLAPQLLASSTLFNQKKQPDSWTLSQIKSNVNIQNDSMTNFLSQLKLVAFITKQNRESRQYLIKKEKYIKNLRVQIDQMEEQLKLQRLRYDKKQREFKASKLRTKSKRQKKNREIAIQLQQLNISINRMRTKIKYRKLKTQPINASLSENRKLKGNDPMQMRKKQANPLYFPHTMYMYQPPSYFQRPTEYPLPNQIHINQPRNMEQQWQNRLNDSNFKNYTAEKYKMKTEATHESKLNQQPLTDSRRRRVLSGKSTPRTPPNSKNLAKVDGSNKKNSSFKQTDSVELKRKKQQKLFEDQNKLKSNILNYLSECQSENESQYNFIALNIQKQTKQPKENLRYKQKKAESEANTQQKQIQSDQWMQLMAQSRERPSKAEKKVKAPTKNLETDFMKVFDEISQKFSQRGSIRSKVNLTFSSEQQRQKQVIQSSSESSKKRENKNNMGQSVVAITLSGANSSKISRRSMANSFNDATEKQTSRYMPHLAKEFMRIQEENEEIASLKTTPNQFGTPRNHSQNQKTATPTNSQKYKKISIIQQQAQEEISPIKNKTLIKSSIKSSEKIDQLQKQGFMSKIQLRVESKNHKTPTPFGSKQEDDDLLAGICLVGQSKISRLKSSSQRRSIEATKNDIDDAKQLKTKSEFKKQSSSQVDQLDDFNFVLGEQSKIVKKSKREPTTGSKESSNSKAGQQEERSRYSTSSFNENTIEQKEEEQEDSPSNNQNDRKKARKH